MENNDKAKRILFGRTDIGDEQKRKPLSHKERIEYIISENGVTASSVNMPLVVHSEDIEEMKWDIKLLAEAYIGELNRMIRRKEPFEFVQVETFIRDKETPLKGVIDYCHDNNCSIQDLIEAHKSMKGYWGE